MENFEKSPSIFAVMIPANNAARASFSQVAQKMLEDKDWNPTARQNIQANEESIQVSTDSSVSENDGNNTTPKPSSPASIGCYVFDFANPPRQPGNGWLIGSGKFSGCELSPDILLTERKNHDHVSSRHARLGHNFKSGALVVTTSDSRIVAIDGEDLKHGDGEGSKDDDISKRGQRVIHKKTTSLEFGELKYRLELRTYDLDIHFRQDLKVYKNMNGIMDADYPPILLATPAKSDHVIQEYILKNPVGEGSTCVVYAAHDRRNGDAVAVKKVKRSRSNAKSIDRDCAISAYLGKHPRICHLIDCVDTEPGRGYEVFRIDELLMIYTPLAMGTVEEMIPIGTHVGIQTRAKMFWQILEGIEFLHSKKVMHRDIKPSNMAVVSADPEDPQAVLIDFGWATVGLQSYEYFAGTCSYQAPEMLAGIDNKTNYAYDEKVDIFAFGLSMYQLCCQQPIHWNRIDTDGYGNVSAYMILTIQEMVSQSSIPEGLKKWIVSCIFWDPHRRPSAKRILAASRGDQSSNVKGQTEAIGSGRGNNEVKDEWDELRDSIDRIGLCESGEGISRERPTRPKHELPPPSQDSPERGEASESSLRTK